MENVDHAVHPWFTTIPVSDVIVVLYLEVQGFAVTVQAARSTSTSEKMLTGIESYSMSFGGAVNEKCKW